MADYPKLGDMRAWPRSLISATAITIDTEKLSSKYQIENLSAGGVLLSGGPEMIINRDYRLILNLPQSRPIEVTGCVVRVQTTAKGNKSYALVFHGVDPDTQDLIHNILLAQPDSRKRKSPITLVVDDCENTRRAMERDLRALGIQAVLAAMPLDALRWLCGSKIPIDIAIVDLHLGPADGMQLLKYLEIAHPNIQRILISGRQSSCQLELAVSFKRVHAVLPKPWSREQIAEVIGRLITVGSAA